MTKKKILIDLDILTVAFWDNKKEAIEFLNRVRKGEFELYIPYSLFELLGKWKHKPLTNKIIEFYKLFGLRVISAQDILNEFKKNNLDYEKIVNEFQQKKIKEEDITLILITSIFDLDYLITYNKIHLKNKKEVINSILRYRGLKEIIIIEPTEI